MARAAQRDGVGGCWKGAWFGWLRSWCGNGANFADFFQCLAQVIRRRAFEFCDVFRCTFGDEASAIGAGIGPEVDDPIGAFDHIEIVLDHQQRVSGIDEFLKHAEQAFDVGEVETGGGLVENEKLRALRR